MKKVVSIFMSIIVCIGVVAAFALLPSIIADKWAYYSSKKSLKDQVLEDDIDE